MENLNEVLERIETLLKELRDSFLESRRWGADNTFIDTINEIYNLIKYEKESLTRQKEEMIFLEGQILTNLNNVLIDLIKKIKESMDSSVNEVRNVIKPSIYEFRNLMDSSVKEVRKATESFNNYLQKKKFLSSAKKELKELRSKVHYFKKMQVGRDYNFSIQISYNNDNFLTLKFEDLDFISTEFTIGELPKKAEDGFIIRLIAPSMTINPSFRKIVIDSENKLAFYKHIYFKITPNYSGAFIIMMELTLEDEIISPPKEFEVSVQNKGLEWDCKDKTHKRQLSASAVKFFSINFSIIWFLITDILSQSNIFGFWYLIGYLIFFPLAFICSYIYAKRKGYGWYRKSKIIESNPNNIYEKKKGQD